MDDRIFGWIASKGEGLHLCFSAALLRACEVLQPVRPPHAWEENLRHLTRETNPALLIRLLKKRPEAR